MATPAAAQEAAEASPIEVEVGTPIMKICRRGGDLCGRPEGGWSDPYSGGSWLLPGQDREKMAALSAAQEANRVPPTAVEAGAPREQDEEKLVALMAAQKAGGAPPTAGKLGCPLDEIGRQQRPLWLPKRLV
jgi:hypothetical protein